MNKHDCILLKRSLYVLNYEFNIILCHEILFFFTFSIFKNVKMIIISQTIWKPAVDWIWSMGHNLSSSDLEKLKKLFKITN